MTATSVVAATVRLFTAPVSCPNAALKDRKVTKSNAGSVAPAGPA